MKYCVMRDYFQFNPSKVNSIENAYHSQIEDDTEGVAIYDTLDAAKELLAKLTPSFHKFSNKVAEAVVYMIRECEWYFDDEYYAENEIEKDWSDLETFDVVLFKAAEDSFDRAMNDGEDDE